MVYSRSKYHSKKITVDGEVFDSKKEAQRYQTLKLMQKAGQISNLQRQVRYVLIPAQREPDTNKAVRAVEYRADFVYEQDGKSVVEDVKGYRNPRDPAYRIFKRSQKAMLYLYGIWIKEI